MLRENWWHSRAQLVCAKQQYTHRHGGTNSDGWKLRWLLELPPDYQFHGWEYFATTLMQWTGIAILNAHAGELCYGDDVYSFHLCKDEIRRDVTMGHEVPVANKSTVASA